MNSRVRTPNLESSAPSDYSHAELEAQWLMGFHFFVTSDLNLYEIMDPSFYILSKRVTFTGVEGWGIGM